MYSFSFLFSCFYFWFTMDAWIDLAFGMRVSLQYTRNIISFWSWMCGNLIRKNVRENKQWWKMSASNTDICLFHIFFLLNLCEIIYAFLLLWLESLIKVKIDKLYAVCVCIYLLQKILCSNVTNSYSLVLLQKKNNCVFFCSF